MPDLKTLSAEAIVRALAEFTSPLTWESGNGTDWCMFCSKAIPYGKIGEYPVAGQACCPRHPDDIGHYAVGSVSFCGELRVPVMRDSKGVLEGTEYHDAECVWRQAREWVAQNDH